MHPDFSVPSPNELRKIWQRLETCTQGDVDVNEALRLLDELRLYHAALESHYEALHTAQRRLEKVLCGEEQQYRIVVENASDVIAQLTPDAQYLYVSPSVTDLLGFSPEELLDAPRSYDFYHPDDVERVRATHRSVLTTPGTHRVTYRRQHKSGHYVWVETTARGVFDEDTGAIQYIITATRDTTAPSSSNEPHQRTEDTYRQLFENVHDAIIIFRPEDEVVLEANRKACDLYGYSRSEFIGMSLQQVSTNVERGQREIQEVISQSDRHRFEVKQKRKDGTTIVVEINASLTDYKGETAVLSVNRDITERKRREQELIRAKEEAKEMSRLKSAFLANMSHEIRTPLTSILGFADVLSEQLDEESHEFLEMIRRAGTRLQRTLTAVLELAQLESETMELHPESLDLVREMHDVADLYEPHARQKGLTFQRNLPEGPVSAQLDPNALNRVLTNLVSNAIKFTESGTVRMGLGVSEGQARIVVEDTGIGIGEEGLDLVFEDFKQESEGLARNYEGVGLGLPITKRLVDLMGGIIAADSTKGEGSTFTVTLPIDDPAPASPPPAPEPADEAASESADIQSARVLFVEDNELTREVIPPLIDTSDTPYAVDTAATVGEALRRIENGSYDALLIDINLGADTSGIDLMKTLRSRPRYADTPMIACTAYASPKEEQRFLRQGFDAYLTKPFRRDDLLATIKALLQ